MVSRAPDRSTEYWKGIIDENRAYADGYADFKPGEVAKNKWLRVLRRHMAPGATVMEAGCGAAYASITLARGGYKVIALDIAPRIIENLREFRRGLVLPDGGDLKAVVGDIFALREFEPGRRLDAIFNHGVYEHWLARAERRGVLASVYDRLPVGGKYLVAVPNLINPLFRCAVSHDWVPEMHAFTLRALAEELTGAGFTIVERGHLFVFAGYEQWTAKKWLAGLIGLVARCYNVMPRVLQGLLAAHLYCVAEKRDVCYTGGARDGDADGG